MKQFLKRLSVLALFLGAYATAQDINQLDENGKHHGVWKQYYTDTKVLRYEGEFFHGKEIGEFKFYKNENGKAVLAATKMFNKADDITQVAFFNSQGKVISEGKMNGRKYIGTWKYYQNKGRQLLTLEHYNNDGELHGERFVYYENGQPAEEQHYVDGKLEGTSKWFTENGIVLKAFIYVNGELHGLAKYYDPKGQLITEGHYKSGKKTGVWKFYENGKLKEEKDFTYKPKYIKENGKYKKAPQ